MVAKLKQSPTQNDSSSTVSEPDISPQDWLDIVWQSALEAQKAGLPVEFIEFAADNQAGILLSGVVVKDGRPVSLTQSNGGR